MNFFFGQTHSHSVSAAQHNQTEWLNKTIFTDYKDCVSTHIEDGFSLTLVNDPKRLCSYQSKSIYVDEKYVCATDCQLFNKNELATRLEISTQAANEKFFVYAYLKWGHEFPNYFDGKFSFVIWDRVNKILLSGLDALGYGNFSYSHIENDFYFSSDLATLLDQSKVDKSINMKRFYQCFRYSNNTPEQTYFQKCFYCPPSHVLKVENNKVETFDYWKLVEKNCPKHKKDESAYTKEFIELLCRAIKKETRGKPNLGLMLSGGYDSSLLAAILAKNPDWKNSLTCYSYTFGKFKSCDESKYIKQTLRQLDLKGKLINCDNKSVLSDIGTRHSSKDVINMDAYNALPETLYSIACQENKQILISGLNGDDIFGGVDYMYADLIRKRNFVVIIKSVKNANNRFKQLVKLLNFGIRPLLPKWSKSLYRLIFRSNHLLANEFGIKAEDVNSVESEKLISNTKCFQQQKLLKLIYYRNSSENSYFLRKRLYLKHNLEYLMPYYNKNLIEFMWTLPTENLEKNGMFRGVQINALNFFNLRQVTDRPSKTSFVALIDQGILENQYLIKKICDTSVLLRYKMIQEHRIFDMAKDIANRKPSSYIIIYFIMAELWFKKVTNNCDSFNEAYRT